MPISKVQKTLHGKVNQVASSLPGEAQALINSLPGALSGGGGGGGGGGAADPNLATMRTFSKKMVQTAFREVWQFRVEVDDAPGDWDLYCKEIVQTPIELEANTQRVGAHYLSYLSSAQPVSLSMTMRDNEDGRIYDWFSDWVDTVVYPDGTWGLPVDYLKTLKIYVRDNQGGEYLRQELRVQPMVLGEITETVERTGSLLEFPVTLLEFRGSGLAY